MSLLAEGEAEAEGEGYAEGEAEGEAEAEAEHSAKDLLIEQEAEAESSEGKARVEKSIGVSIGYVKTTYSTSTGTTVLKEKSIWWRINSTYVHSLQLQRRGEDAMRKRATIMTVRMLILRLPT